MAQAFHGAARRLVEPLIDHWLEHVVHRLDLERANRVLVVRGDENDQWLMGRRRLAQRLEAAQPRHLNVEKHQVGFVLGDRRHRRAAAGRLTDNLDVGVRGEQRTHPAARKRLVVDDERPNTRA